MYDSVRRSCAVGAAALVVAVGATACTGDSGDGAARDDGRARAASCTDGEYAWSGVRHRTKLTALGEPVTFAKGTAPTRPVWNRWTPTRSTGPRSAVCPPGWLRPG